MSGMNENEPYVAWMPHAPILIPDIAGERSRDVVSSQSWMAQAGKEIAATDPDIVVLVSPHSPRKRDAFGVYRPTVLRGVLDQFGWHQPFFEFSNNLYLANGIQQRGADEGLLFFDIPTNSLDHGATVPLYFLSQAEWCGDIVVIGLGPHDGGMLERLGTCIRSACDDQGLSFALIASGDMSHRVTASAPCGFHPDAAAWDQDLIQMVQGADSEAIKMMDECLRNTVAEDSVDAIRVALGFLGDDAFQPEVLGYEAPFGVGYGTARLSREPFPSNHSKHAHDEDTQKKRLPSLAWQAVMEHLKLAAPSITEPIHSLHNWKAGTFVTIRSRNGDLRGCIGTIEPQQDNIVEETRRNAVASAFRDHRFSPVTSDELDDLQFEVSVLHPPHPVTNLKTLNPQCDGLIIQTKAGRRGLMLPDIPQLDTVEKQIEAICRKVNIPLDTPMDFQTFRVEKIKEDSV